MINPAAQLCAELEAKARETSEWLSPAECAAEAAMWEARYDYQMPPAVKQRWRELLIGRARR